MRASAGMDEDVSDARDAADRVDREPLAATVGNSVAR